MATTTTKLDVASRDPHGSRSARRLRRTGRIPGVLYGGGSEPVSFSVDARELRLALAGSGAVVDLSVDGSKPTPVVLKEAQRDPVRGHTTHVDLLRVRLDRPIHAVVPLELAGIEDTSGVKEGGILEQLTRELNIEALPHRDPRVDRARGRGDGDRRHACARGDRGSRRRHAARRSRNHHRHALGAALQTEEEVEIESETELVGEAGAQEGETPADGAGSASPEE